MDDKSQRRGEPVDVPVGWKEQFKEAVYDNLAAADNQDIPLEEYPDRILKVLETVVGPRHPTVVKWRNDAIKTCLSIAHKYCRDAEAQRYLKQDLEALITAAPQPAEPVSAPKHLIERLQKHSEDKSNTAFARSTMREALQYLTAEPSDETEAMEAVMESIDPATWPGLTIAQRCALGRFAKPQPAEPSEDDFTRGYWQGQRDAQEAHAEWKAAQSTVKESLTVADHPEQGLDMVEPVKVRPETDSEHIARDIREGRFPEKSDRKMVPAEPVKRNEEYKPEYKYCEDGTVVWTNAADAPVVKSSEPVKVPSDDLETLRMMRAEYDPGNGPMSALKAAALDAAIAALLARYGGGTP